MITINAIPYLIDDYVDTSEKCKIRMDCLDDCPCELHLPFFEKSINVFLNGEMYELKLYEV